MITVLIISVSGIAFSLYVNNNKLENSKDQYNEMIALKDEFLLLKDKIDSLERKKKLIKVKGIIPAVDEVVSSLGLKNRIKSVKPLGSRDISGDVEEEAEVILEKLSMNEAVNLFYRIENAPMLLVLKNARMKTAFEGPDILNLTLVISLVYEK